MSQDLGQKAAKESQVQQQMNELSKAINDLRDIGRSAEERLAKVLTPPRSAGETLGEEPTIVPLAADLRLFVKEIQEITSQFNEILSRLEL